MIIQTVWITETHVCLKPDFCRLIFVDRLKSLVCGIIFKAILVGRMQLGD
jgi:hypothetical protein